MTKIMIKVMNGDKQYALITWRRRVFSVPLCLASASRLLVCHYRGLIRNCRGIQPLLLFVLQSAGIVVLLVVSTVMMMMMMMMMTRSRLLQLQLQMLCTYWAQ